MYKNEISLLPTYSASVSGGKDSLNMLKFLEDLYNYIIKYNIDFVSLSYLDQKKVIRKCLKIICHNNSQIRLKEKV